MCNYNYQTLNLIKNKSKATAFFLFIFLLFCIHVHAQTAIVLSDKEPELPLSFSYSYLIDSSHSISSSQILNKRFTDKSGKVPVFDVGVNKVWFRFLVYNHTKSSECYLNLKYTNLSKVTLYKVINNEAVLIQSQGNSLPLSKNDNLTPNFVFPMNLPIEEKHIFFLEVESIHPIIVPAYISSEDGLVRADIKLICIIALYCGIIGTMLIYNLFLFVSVRDKNYLIYSIYTFTLLLAQLTAAGYMYKYVWTNYPKINDYSVVVTTNFTFIIGTLYSYNFLQIKKYLPQIRWMFFLIASFCFIDIILDLFYLHNLSYQLHNYVTIITCLLLLTSSILVARKGFSPAILYLIAWSFLFLSVIVLALRNLNIIPYNSITASTVYIGSAIETVLLSFALASKINVLRGEKDASQAQALLMLQRNEQLTRDQNIFLETKIEERTHELKVVNNDLQKTLKNLTDTQIQLVESEKMSSLGQLTAGIAHEINNPINFVKSNVSPLQMDVHDLFELITEYQQLHGTDAEELLPKLNNIKALENKLDPEFLKEEIENLIGGIEEGAERTAEIVRGLRIFSRLDESEVKEANIYDNINSTLVLLRNTAPHYLKIRKHYNAPGQIECYPGKLNQVFMNILTNGIHAIKAKPEKNEEEYLDISVIEEDGYMQITISDSGTGMTEEVKRKIFDPFFTTKDVGEGTGLGMSIVFKIIELHHGKITVISSPGKGSSFIISIPYMLKSVAALAGEQGQPFDEQAQPLEEETQSL